MISEDKVMEIFFSADEFLKEFEAAYAAGPKKLSSKKRRNRKGRMSPSEIITILICFHFSGYRTFKFYYMDVILGKWKSLFPNALSYNRFVEVQPRCFMAAMAFLQSRCFGKCTGITFIDSTCIPVIHNKRQYSMRVFKDFATKGKSTMGWYIGFKLHLVCNERGEILNFALTRANVDDRNPHVIDVLTDKVIGKLYADKGYISQTLFNNLWDKGLHVVTGIRSNMKNRLMSVRYKILLRKRSVIESVNDMLKNVAQVMHTRHRSLHNFIMNIMGAIGAYSFFAVKPAVNFDFELPDEGQLMLW